MEKPKRTRDYCFLADLWHEKNVYEKLKAMHEKKIRNLFHWDFIHDFLNKQDKDAIMNFWEHKNGEEPVYGMYICSVFSLFPSGKYYTPWANSHVTAKEALQDEVFREALENVLYEKGLYMVHGEGDPCDIFFCKEIPLTSINWEYWI